MKPSAFLINLARGPIAEEEALYRALRDGAIGGAALDTWWRYPSPAEPAPRPSRYPFHELANVIMTPHCSPRTDGTIERRSRDVARNTTALSAASRWKTWSPRPEKIRLCLNTPDYGHLSSKATPAFCSPSKAPLVNPALGEDPTNCRNPPVRDTGQEG
jgi:hypothetical protein